MTATSFHDWASCPLPAGEVDYPALAVAAGGSGKPGFACIDGDRFYVEGVSQARLDAALAAYDPGAALKAALTARAAACRYAVETGGIVVAGAPVATDRESQSMIANALAYVTASAAPTVSYKSPAGFVTLTADQIRALALAVGAHVQACFAAEDRADAGINASPATITTPAQVDAVFAALGPPAA